MPRTGKSRRNTSGRGISNQQKPGLHKQQTGNRAFNPEEPERDIAADRNRGEQEKDVRSARLNERTFNILVDSVPYMVKTVPFRFNDEVRYRVSYNGSPEHVFTWDSDLAQLRAIDDESSALPDNLEIAISEKLQSRS